MDREYSYEEDYKSNIEVKANEILKATNWQVRSHNKMNTGYITDSVNNCIKKLERLEYKKIEESKYFEQSYHVLYPTEGKIHLLRKALDVLEPYLSEP